MLNILKINKKYGIINKKEKVAIDVVFKALFVRNPDILRAFLRDILDLPITDNDKITILNPELIPDFSEGKLSRLDIHVEMKNRRFNIEMQTRKNGFSAERVLYYWAELYSEKFESGGKYEELEQTISINVLGFKFLNCENYHSSYSILEDSRYEKFTDKLSIHVFELPKVPKEIISGDAKQQWMELIRADSEEALEMVRTTTENPAIQKGIDAVYALNADTVLREQIRQREKAIRDYENDMATSRSEGISIGEAKGRAEGEAKGRTEERNALIKKMRKRGMSEDEIKEFFAD